MEKEKFDLQRRRRTEKEKEEDMGRRKTNGDVDNQPNNLVNIVESTILKIRK